MFNLSRVNPFPILCLHPFSFPLIYEPPFSPKDFLHSLWNFHGLLHKLSFCFSCPWASFYFEFPDKLPVGLCPCYPLKPTYLTRYVISGGKHLKRNMAMFLYKRILHDFRVFEYLSSSLYLIIVDAGKINSMKGIHFYLYI